MRRGLLILGLVGCAAVRHPPPAAAPERAPPVPAATPEKPPAPETAPVIDSVLEEAFRADPILAPYAEDAVRRRLQVLIALPTIDPNGVRALRRFVFRPDAEYFYPASAVKLLIAVAAVEKLEELREQPGGSGLELKTPVRFTEREGGRRRVVESTLHADLERALVVSDNDASNRLFDFVGKEELADRLERLGLKTTRVVHALGEVRERDVPPVIELLPPKSRPFPVGQLRGEAFTEHVPPLLVGSTHVDSKGRTVSRAMDFSTKNFAPLRELQDLLIALMRPDLVENGPVPAIGKDRAQLIDLLGTLPSELRGARLPRKTDELYKPLHRAILNALPNDRVRVHGKSGRAYGFLVENSYAVNETTRRSMFVAATIYANESERLNDDRYEYAEIAAPFVARLGDVVARAFLAAP